MTRRSNAPSLAGGSIVDLHDGREFDDDARRLASPLPMIEALPAIVDGLQARGYELVGLDQMDLVDPIQWRPDGRGTFGSAEVRAAIEGLGGKST